MKSHQPQLKFSRWPVVVFYAMAMAWVESAVVYYLRTMIDRIEPHQPNPLPVIGYLGPVEMVRESATLVMIFTVGLLAGRSWRSRFGYMAIAFGIYDICYYVFLNIMTGWPHSLLDWDILFLLPLPWWGPVLAPVLISVMMITWGTLATHFEQTSPVRLSNVATWGINLTGVCLALYVFMADAIRVSGDGVNAVRNVLPERFNWPLFSLALLLMFAPIIRLLAQSWSKPRTDFETAQVN